MRVGSVHLSGPRAWPDHVLSYDLGTLLAGAVFQIRGFALGLEIHGKCTNPWAGFYLGFCAFELYWDRDGSWDE